MRFPFFTYIILGLFFICASCSNKPYQVLFQQQTKARDSVLQKISASITNYRIKPQDILQIRNLQNSKNILDLNPNIGTTNTQGSNVTSEAESFHVEDDGTVALTGLGHVHVGGLTRFEAIKLIEDMYRTQFLEAPIIDIKITNLTVTIYGEAKGQGAFPLTKDRVTLVEMLGLAGGLTDKADESNVEIIRSGNTSPIVIPIDLRDIRSISDPRTILQNGDVIYIAPNKRAVRSDKIQTLTTIVQPALLILTTALLIITFIRR